MAQLIFYPSLDGEPAHVENPGVAWSAIRAGGGTSAQTSSVGYRTGWETRSFWENAFHILVRQILIFDTSNIPDGATITSASLYLQGTSKPDPVSNTPNINIYSASPASDTELVSGDFDSFGSTPYCDTTISHANWDTGDFNEFALNAIGLAAISKTGKTIFGVREVSHDVDGAIPTWRGNTGDEYTHIGWRSRNNPDSLKPKLIVIYATDVLVTTDAASSITATTAILNGTLDDEGVGACTCGFDYGTTVAYGSEAINPGTFNTGESFARIASGLSPGTTYHFRAKADDGNEVGYGADRTFVTLGTAYPSEALTRVSALIHRWSPGDRNYTLEVVLGGLSSSAVPLPTSRRPSPPILPDIPTCPTGYVLAWSADRGYFCIPESLLRRERRA